MLTPPDDYLIHQTPEPLERVATSDRNFYDRYYFNCHDLSGETFLVVAMGVYPNLGVIDAFATCVRHNERQFVVKASRELHADRSRTEVGPIGVDVLEGLRLFRVWCEPNDFNLSFDLTFQGVTLPFEEPHFFRRAAGRVVMDYTRLTQPGRWSGELVVHGERLEVTGEGWRGARDHSWGIRPIERAASGAPARDGPRGFFWNWAPIQFDDHAVMYTISEDHDGTRWHEAAARLHAYDTQRPPEPLSVVRHDLRLKPGTRTFDGGSVVLAEPDGRQTTMDFEPLSLLHMAGAGYAYQPDLWRHGEYHGELAVDGEVWDLTNPELLKRVAGQSETVCRVQHDGRTGHGIFEFILFGLYEPYGFRSLTDVAPASGAPLAANPAPEPPASARTPPPAQAFEPAPEPSPEPEPAPPPEPEAAFDAPESRAEQLLRARRELQQRDRPV